MSEEIIIAIIGSGALSAIISSLMAAITNRKNSNKALQLLLLGEIKRQGKEYISEGEIDVEDLQAFNETYQCYKQLKGNGFAESIKNKVNSLNVKVK